MDSRRTATPSPELRYMNTRHVATYIGRTPKAVERMRERGGGPPWFYTGSTPTYDRLEVDSYFAQQPRRSTTSPGVSP